MRQRLMLWAAALVACHRRMHGNKTVGSRRLFDAVNEAFTSVAHGA